MGRSWFAIAIVVSVALSAATGYLRLLPADSALYGILRNLDLSSENVIAAWWSGMLLLLASLHAYDGAERIKFATGAADTSRSRGDASRPDATAAAGAARAWLIIAGILLFFSADELASGHERIGTIAWLFGHSEFVMYGFLALLLGGLAMYALYGLWRVPDLRRSAAGIFLGFALLASVAIQEYVEHAVEWSGSAIALRVVVEEGTELAGILLILFVTMPNTIGMHHGRPPLESIEGGRLEPFGALRPLTWRAVAVGLAICIGLSILSAGLSDQGRGHPADWFAAAAFLCAALLESRPDIRRLGIGAAGEIGSGRDDAGADPRGSADRRPGRALAVTAIIASATAVALAPVDLVEVGPVWLNLRLTALSGLVGLVAIFGYARARVDGLHGGTSRRRVYGLLAGSAVVAFGVGLALSTDLFLSYLFTTLLGLGCYGAVAARTAPIRT